MGSVSGESPGASWPLRGRFIEPFSQGPDVTGEVQLYDPGFRAVFVRCCGCGGGVVSWRRFWREAPPGACGSGVSALSFVVPCTPVLYLTGTVERAGRKVTFRALSPLVEARSSGLDTFL